SLDEHRTVGWHSARGGQCDLLRGEAERVERAAQPAKAVLLGEDDTRAVRIVAVRLQALEVRVVLEVVDVVLAVPHGKAHGLHRGPGDAQDTERDVTVVDGV